MPSKFDNLKDKGPIRVRILDGTHKGLYESKQGFRVWYALRVQDSYEYYLFVSEVKRKAGKKRDGIAREFQYALRGVDGPQSALAGCMRSMRERGAGYDLVKV